MSTTTAPMPQHAAPEPPPPKRNWVLIAVVAVAALLVGAGTATIIYMQTHHNATATQSAQTTKPKPAVKQTPKKTTPAPVAPAPAVSAYAQRILAAGIVAPAAWIDKTGQTLIADWKAGYTEDWTNANVLTAGGVRADHLALFNQITSEYFGVYPPAPAPAPAPAYDSVSVVQAFYNALNNKDFQTAWNLGGKNIGGSDYASWVAGYSTTVGVHGWAMDLGNGVVQASFDALQTDGSVKSYSGTYTVSGGVIVAANMAQTG